MKDRLKKIMTSLSEWREQVNTIATVAEPSEAQTVELTELRGKLTAGETEYRAALDAEGDTEVAVTAEDRARRELRPKARLTSYIGATVDATPFTGAEAEFAAAHACRAGFMPLEMLLPEAREERDVTPGVTAPGATATIAPFSVRADGQRRARDSVSDGRVWPSELSGPDDASDGGGAGAGLRCSRDGGGVPARHADAQAGERRVRGSSRRPGAVAGHGGIAAGRDRYGAR